MAVASVRTSKRCCFCRCLSSSQSSSSSPEKRRIAPNATGGRATEDEVELGRRAIGCLCIAEELFVCVLLFRVADDDGVTAFCSEENMMMSVYLLFSILPADDTV